MLLRRREHTAAAPAVETPADAGAPTAIWPPPALPPLSTCAASCCCPAAAAFQVLMPARGGREAQEILLCHHHLRTSRAALLEAGAALYDADGRRLQLDEAGTTPERTVVGARVGHG